MFHACNACMHVRSCAVRALGADPTAATLKESTPQGEGARQLAQQPLDLVKFKERHTLHGDEGTQWVETTSKGPWILHVGRVARWLWMSCAREMSTRHCRAGAHPSVVLMATETQSKQRLEEERESDFSSDSQIFRDIAISL